MVDLSGDFGADVDTSLQPVAAATGNSKNPSQRWCAVTTGRRGRSCRRKPAGARCAYLPLPVKRARPQDAVPTVLPVAQPQRTASVAGSASGPTPSQRRRSSALASRRSAGRVSQESKNAPRGCASQRSPGPSQVPPNGAKGTPTQGSCEVTTSGEWRQSFPWMPSPCRQRNS